MLTIVITPEASVFEDLDKGLQKSMYGLSGRFVEIEPSPSDIQWSADRDRYHTTHVAGEVVSPFL